MHGTVAALQPATAADTTLPPPPPPHPPAKVQLVLTPNLPEDVLLRHALLWCKCSMNLHARHTRIQHAATHGVDNSTLHAPSPRTRAFPPPHPPPRRGGAPNPSHEHIRLESRTICPLPSEPQALPCRWWWLHRPFYRFGKLLNGNPRLRGCARVSMHINGMHCVCVDVRAAGNTGAVATSTRFMKVKQIETAFGLQIETTGH